MDTLARGLRNVAKLIEVTANVMDLLQFSYAHFWMGKLAPYHQNKHLLDT
jgi:hypothetical protein